MEAGVDAFRERRAGREREQLGQPVADAVDDGDRTVGATDPHVHVQPEGVVLPDDVPEELVVAPVVRRVDDPLILPVGPRMRARRPERDPEPARGLQQLGPTLRERCDRFRDARTAARLDLDLGGDQLAGDVVCERRLVDQRPELLVPVDHVEAVGIEECELLLHGHAEVGSVVEALTCLSEELVVADRL